MRERAGYQIPRRFGRRPPPSARRDGKRVHLDRATSEASAGHPPPVLSPLAQVLSRSDRNETLVQEIAMSKRTHDKVRQAQPSPPSQEGVPAPARPADGPGRQTAAPKAAPPALGGAGKDAGPARERVAARAYQLWEARGRPEGTDRENWIEAERQLRAEVR